MPPTLNTSLLGCNKRMNNYVWVVTIWQENRIRKEIQNAKKGNWLLLSVLVAVA